MSPRHSDRAEHSRVNHSAREQRDDLGNADQRPFNGVTAVEMAGIGPGPFAGMMLSDFGAEVIRIDRTDRVGVDHPLMGPSKTDVMSRGRRSIALDLKRPEGMQLAIQLISQADVLIDPFRPGVMERLGLAPHECMRRKPDLIVARVTGWGQTGPRAKFPGHDINYLARAGALSAMGAPDQVPAPPLNLVADFGGGGMLAAFGIAAALLERTRSGRGQVIDAAMIDGVSSLMASIYGFRAGGRWRDARSDNLLDGGAPFYRCYATASGDFVAVGALEPEFYASLLKALDLNVEEWPQNDRARWANLTALLTDVFATHPAEHWAEVFADGSACVSVVATLAESHEEPQIAQRDTLVRRDGVQQPAPAPRLERTPGRIGGVPPVAGADTEEILTELGRSPAAIAGLERDGVVSQA